MTLNPQGVDKYGVLNGDNANGFFSVLSDDLTTVVSDLAWPHPLPTTPPTNATSYRIVDIKPALNGGVLVGVSSAYDANSPNQGLALWMGANKANYSRHRSPSRAARPRHSARAASTRTSRPALALRQHGRGLHDDADRLRQVGQLRHERSRSNAAARTTSPRRRRRSRRSAGSRRRSSPGRSPSTRLDAGDGRLDEVHLAGSEHGTWQLYRASDMSFVGKVASVQSEIALTLTANAAVAMAGENYIASARTRTTASRRRRTTKKVGFLTRPTRAASGTSTTARSSRRRTASGSATRPTRRRST
jgi:hypothetical protein